MKKKISIIVPIYNESENIEVLINKLFYITKDLDYIWEFIFVDDCSSDNSLEKLIKLKIKYKNIKVISLSKNFGKEIALTAGLDQSKDSSVIFIDADLQHPPELIPKLIYEWEQGAEIVATIRTKINGRSFLKKISSKMFYLLINIISETKMQSQTTDFRLIDLEVAKVLKTFTERGRMVRGLIDWMGFRKVYVDFEAPDRNNGNEGYSYRKLFGLAIDSISSFSLFPLKLTGYLGLLIIILSGFLLTFMIFNEILLKVTTFTPLAVVVVGNTFLIGIVLSCIGILGLYIGKIHTEIVNRPLYIKRKINFDNE